MIIPIRCFSCGCVLANKWLAYVQEKEKIASRSERFYLDGSQLRETPENMIMQKLKIKRPCCRVIFLTHVDLMEKI